MTKLRTVTSFTIILIVLSRSALGYEDTNFVKTVIEYGKSGVLKCVYDEQKDSEAQLRYWLFGEEVIATQGLLRWPEFVLDSGVGYYNLVVKEASDELNGKYECVLGNVKKIDMHHNGWELIVAHPITDVRINLTPPMAKEGTTVSVECVVEGGFPNVYVFMYRNVSIRWETLAYDKLIYDRDTLKRTVTLDITASAVDEEYICSAYNPHIANSSGTQAAAKLEILPPALQTMHTYEMKDLEIVSIGQHHATLRWYVPFTRKHFKRVTFQVVYVGAYSKRAVFDCGVSNPCQVYGITEYGKSKPSNSVEGRTLNLETIRTRAPILHSEKENFNMPTIETPSSNTKTLYGATKIPAEDASINKLEKTKNPIYIQAKIENSKIFVRIVAFIVLMIFFTAIAYILWYEALQSVADNTIITLTSFEGREGSRRRIPDRI